MAVELASSQTTPMAVEPVAAQRRRLMAVMLADVVNYSRMMSRSEDETHARFASHARELIEPTIDKYGGRLVRSMGDGILVEFSSAVDAVRCALDIQRGLAARQANEKEKEKDRIQLRIGINTGDILVDQREFTETASISRPGSRPWPRRERYASARASTTRRVLYPSSFLRTAGSAV
jgi:class 3 adenylate cyclase